MNYFITGTDTNAGKTWVTVALMQYLKQQNKTVIGMKPVASGCEWQNGQLRNADALLLQQHSSVTVPYEFINPYAYLEPVSPHLAAAATDKFVELPKIDQILRALQQQADNVLVEGVGGWLAPINHQHTVADMARYLNLPVILVVGIRLGCINHACLTELAINQAGLSCVGWIANCLDPVMLKQQENIESLQQRLHSPLLAVLPYGTQQFNWHHFL